MSDALKLLGPSPSTVLQSEVAAPIHATGYQVTDFAGLFTVPKARFLVTVGATPAHRIEEGIRIKSAGSLPIRSGTVVVSDPCDFAHFDQTNLAVAARVSLGDHDVHVAQKGDSVLAAVVVFTGESEVVGWLPALLGNPAPPMPTPPMFPMPPVRFSLGLGDAVLMDEILREVLVEMDETRAATLDSTFGAGRAASPRPLVADGTHPALSGVRRDLAGSARPKLLAAHGGLVAFRCEKPPTAWLGLDHSGEPRALAFDFGALRRWDSEPHVSAPGLLLHRDSLSARFRAAGHASADAQALAGSLLERVRACEKDLTSFEPSDADRSVFAMPIGLRTEAIRATVRATEARAHAEATPAVTSPVSLYELELSVGASNVLQDLGLETVSDLVAMTEGELVRAFKKHGRDASKAQREVRYIQATLAELSLALRSG